MVDKRIIRIYVRRIQPEYEERYWNWALETYFPLLAAGTGISGIDTYHIVDSNPQYPDRCTFLRYDNQEAQLKLRLDPRFVDIQKDSIKTWGSRSEIIWFFPYEEDVHFENRRHRATGDSGSGNPESPVIHLDGYALSGPEQEKYDRWFERWGKGVFVPLEVRLPGLMEYSHYHLIDVGWENLSDYYRPKRPVIHPSRLSVLTFENIRAFREYEKSLEREAYKAALHIPFPMGLTNDWYVQYQLVKSFRK